MNIEIKELNGGYTAIFNGRMDTPRLFLTLRKETSTKGGKVIIKNINDEIKKVFMMTGFFNLFEIK